MLAARIISILGHPVIFVPAVLGLSMALGWLPFDILKTIGPAAFLVILPVIGFSAFKVAQGEWAHIDASGINERRGLYPVIISALLLAALIGVWFAWAMPIILGLVIMGAMVVAAYILSIRIPFRSGQGFKTSLHVSFAAFAAMLPLLGDGPVWTHLAAIGQGVVGQGGAALGLLGTAAIIGWSRLRLKRHSLAEVIAGFIIGLIGGGLMVFGA